MRIELQKRPYNRTNNGLMNIWSDSSKFGHWAYILCDIMDYIDTRESKKILEDAKKFYESSKKKILQI